MLGHIPDVGEWADLDGHRLVVTEMDGRRIARVRVTMQPEPEPRAGEPRAGEPEPRAGEPRAGEPEPRAGEPRAGEPRAGEPEPEPRAGEPRAGEPVVAEPREDS
jgi:hypothetical protein